MAAAVRTARLLVSGKVQGVFYRKHTRAAATELGVTGWVRNLPSGDVEIVAEGTAQQLQQLEQWCHKGSPRSKVAGVVVTVDGEEEAGGNVQKHATGNNETQVGKEGGKPPAPSPAPRKAAVTKRKYKSFEVAK